MSNTSIEGNRLGQSALGKKIDKMNDELLYANGNPFHLPGTRIFEEPDGTLMYECGHCGCHPVPLHLLEALRRYARKRE